MMRLGSKVFMRARVTRSDIADQGYVYSASLMRSQQAKLPSTKIVFKICPIQQIPGASPYVYQHETLSTARIEPSRCVCLPQYAEAQILLRKFLHHVNHFPYVTHVPSLPYILEELYTDLNGQRQVKSGHVILLLSIFAGATHSWLHSDCEHSLFSTSAEANEQTPLWIKATEDVLDIAHRSTSVTMEGVQGILIASFVLVNLEGISRRCRSLYSMAYLQARELGLHRIDHPSNAHMANTVQAEIGRRVWWYLCASDW